MQELDKAIEILDKLSFFGGQRAGRELWNDKSREVQDEDIANFNRDIELLRDFIRKRMQKEENVLKFYYCESEDDYYIGKRVQNMYYAKYGPGGFTWIMSRYLPWGKHVTAPETAWKEYTYPTEPKEIPFMEWLEGFIRKHMHDGWISVEERLPENNKLVLVWARSTARGADEWSLGSCDKGFWVLGSYGGSLVFPSQLEAVAWRPLPEPYCPERSEGE